MDTLEESHIVLSAIAASLGSCQLCTRPDLSLQTRVTLTHNGGAVAEFSACENCDRALRRLAAAASGATRLVVGGHVPLATPTVDPVEIVEEWTGPTALIQELSHAVQDADGTFYSPAAVGAQRRDRTWAGWIEFREIGGAKVLRTNRETTQPNQGALAYWAAGLQPSYLEGAFDRARRPHAVRLS